MGAASASSELATVHPITQLTQDPLLTLVIALGKGLRGWWRPLPCPKLLRFCPQGAQRTPPIWLVPRASGAGEPILPANGPSSVVGPGVPPCPLEFQDWEGQWRGSTCRAALLSLKRSAEGAQAYKALCKTSLPSGNSQSWQQRQRRGLGATR